MSIDVEDYFHVENLKPCVSFEGWANQELRVEQNVRKLLDLFESCDTKSTFFILGWVADRIPEMVLEIHGRGHEIACHGYAHRMISEQTQEEFREDVRKAKDILEDIVGEEIIGYRAPTFSVTEDTLWALHILADEGFKYDSSIFPIRHDRYGFPQWNRYMEKLGLQGGADIIEAPPLTGQMLGLRFPVGGGGYFRLAPLWVSSWAVRRMNAEGHPAILYLHPWELDSGQPRFAIPFLKRFRHYINLASTEAKLRRLLNSGSFVRIKDLLP